ncbi:MAG TPA: galactose-1-phosphate uridylyltransferase [Bryobacteraceae bacterium]|jgi:UDPglucose--hexose-1-phosphate uridylyltransferase|nr:galactose-1-phosphate uridylyltransferase [Bryobacteraceae bacterium]
MPELRKDPLTDQWVIIATDRARRPNDFFRQPVPSVPSGRICPFCPGNESKTPPEVLAYRNGSGANQSGWSLRVVPNKFPVLGIEGELDRQGEGIFDKMQGIGAHEVIIESPEHLLSMTELSEKSVEQVLWAFRDRMQDLKNDRRLRYVLLFKNQGEAAGATLEHTHSQLIALPVVPKRVQEELHGARRYYKFKERCLYCDLIRQETKAAARIVTETDRFIVLEPYAARFPFETWILPKQHRSHYEDIDAPHLENLAWVLKSTLRKIDKVLERPPYNFLVHTAPLQDAANAYFHWHIEIIPKLTRVAGFEWGTGFYINPTPPEESAQFLREAGLG